MSQVASKQLTANDGYSAEVRIELYAGGNVLYPSHTCESSLTFDHPTSIPPGTARLVITIDGLPQESTLRILPQAMPSDRILVEIIQKADAP